MARATPSPRTPSNMLRTALDALVVPGSARNAVMVRSGLAAIIVLRLVFRNWWLLSTTPPPLFAKVFAVSWMTGPPSHALVSILWGLALVCALLCVVQIRPQATFVVAWVCFMQLCAMWSSSGKVMHNDVLLIWASVPFLFAAAPRRNESGMDVRWGWAPRASMITIATIYFATGYQKLVHSGPVWVFSDNLSWVIRQGNGIVSPAVSRAIADLTVLTIAAAGVTLLFELGAPILVASRRTRALFAVTVASFHFANYLLMGLDYYGWILAVGVVILMQAPLPQWLSGPVTKLLGPTRLPDAWQAGWQAKREAPSPTRRGAPAEKPAGTARSQNG